MGDFKITTGPTSRADILRFAAEMEAAMGQMMNGDRKAKDLPVEPMARLIQFARDHAKNEAAPVIGAGSKEEDMVKLIHRLSRALAKASPDSKLPGQAIGYLERTDLMDQTRKNILRNPSGRL